MRKFVVLVMTITLVFAVSCSKKEREKTAEIKKGGITDLLPENTEFMLRFGSVETVHKYMSTSDTSMFGKPIKNIEELKGKLGFNPFNVEELRAHGFDPGKEFGVAVADIIVEEKSDKPNFNGLLVIPVTDGKQAIETIKAGIQKQSPGTKVTQEGDMTVFEEATTQTKFYLAVKNTYLFVAVNPKVDAKPFMEAVLAGKSSLTKVKTYTAAMGKIGSDKEIVAYVNLAKIAEKNLNTLKNLSKESAGAKGAPDISASLNYLSDYESIGISLDLASPNLNVKSVINMVADSRSLKMLEGLQANKHAVLGVPEHPVLLFSVLMNASEYYKMMTEAMSEDAARNLKTQLEGIKTSFGIDLENEVINNLAGNFNLGIYDGGSITMGNFNTLFTVSVKDDAVLKSVVDKMIAKLPPEQQAMISKQKVGDVEAYVVMAGPVQLYIGMKEKNLIIAVGKPMFEKALKGDVSSGFVANVADKELAGKFKEDRNILYLNVAETLKAVKNFEMFLQGLTHGRGIDQNVQDAVGKFEYVLASSRLEGTSLFADFTIKTKFTEPFFLEVEKLSKSFVPQSK
jgi:hypothetical protein